MQDNYTILTKAWLEGTSDFQQRIPNPAQYGLAATVNAINDPLNNDLWNQFSNSLNNTIGYSIISALRWENPYNVLRLANLRLLLAQNRGAQLAGRSRCVGRSK